MEMAKAVNEHGQAIAVIKRDIEHITGDRFQCNARHQKALDDLGQRVSAMGTEVSEVKQSFEAIDKKLDDLSASRQQRFEWRVELLKAALAIALALITLVGAGKTLMPKVAAAVADDVSAEVTRAVEANR